MNNLETIAQYLELSLSPQHAKQAESSLRSLEPQPGFLINLLHIVASSNLQAGVRLAAALFFKNLIRRRWVNEDGEYLLPVEDCEHLKSEILGIMITLPSQLQIQIGESISIIADSDFPHKWPGLVDELVNKLSLDDFVLNKGILLVAHSIFKRWRPLFRSDELFLEIKLVLSKFAEPFMALLVKSDELISQSLANNDKASLSIYMECLLLLVQIYYDLNCQDIPEFFEDNMVSGMEIMHKYLSLETTLLTDPDSDEDVDVLIKTKSAIIELISLYVTRYADVFEPLIENFITTVWKLINSYITNQQKFDLLVVKSLSFLTSVTKMAKYQGMFNSSDSLKEIIEKIILPNIYFREVDEEMFEDDPIQFVRSDLEGSDFDSRRKSATDFLRELKEVNTELLTNTVMHYVNQFLSSKDDWKHKDTAIFLFSSLAAKGSITNAGVTSTNVLVDVVKFFSENIANDLVQTDNSIHAILKADAIKYILTFRNQLTKAQLLDTLPLLIQHLKSSNPVVYTYSAITIEKLLSMSSFSDASHAPVFNKDDVQPFIHDLVTNLFALILSGNSSVPEKLAENEFLVKCLMKVLNTAENKLDSSSNENDTKFRSTIITQLLKIIEITSKNPSNPKFSHYVFESLGLLLKFGAHTDQIVGNYVDLIMPPLLEVLGNDVQEFIPYTFQILAYLLELYPSGHPLPGSYGHLIKPLLSPAAWEYRGNIPGITRLLIAILEQDPSVFGQNDNSLTPLLGVFQKLIASKVNDVHGFELLQAIIFSIPVSSLSHYLKDIAVLLLTRLKSSRTEKFVKKFVVFICTLACVPMNQDLSKKTHSLINADFAVDLIDSAQPGVFGQILKSFILPTSSSLANLQDKKLATFGLLQFARSTAFTSGRYSDQLVAVVEQLAKNLSTLEGLQKNTNVAVASSTGGQHPAAVAVDELDLESSSYGSQFSKIVSIQGKVFDPVPDVKSNDFAGIKRGCLGAIAQLGTSGVLEQLSGDAKQVLSSIN